MNIRTAVANQFCNWGRRVCVVRVWKEEVGDACGLV